MARTPTPRPQTRELADVDKKLREALAQPEPEPTATPDGETRERADLAGRVQMRNVSQRRRPVTRSCKGRRRNLRVQRCPGLGVRTGD